MKPLLYRFFVLIWVTVSIAFFLKPLPARASFNPNNIIDDAVFKNYNTMTAAQIDAWLNNWGTASCISPARGFTAPDVIGYSSATSYRYGSDVSAGTIIYHAAQAYGLNPQVILVTLQKEQSLVTGQGSRCNNTDPNTQALAYTAAMGNGCPDNVQPYNYSGFELYSINGAPVTSVTGTCVNTPVAAGFSQQVITATWKLRFWEERSMGNVGWNVQIPPNWDNSDDPPTHYTYLMTQGSFAQWYGGPVTLWDGNASIDGTAVHLNTGATAALYTYTPHFAGNQNFDNLFSSWFGNPTLGCGTNETPMPQVVSLYNPRTYSHFYTAYRCEAEVLGYQYGFVYEGAVFNTTPPSAAGSTAVWRLYNPALGMHLWTTSIDDIRNATQQGYYQEGVAFYVITPNAPNIFPVYRLYNPTTYQHLWTPSQGVINIITQSAGYKLEGVGFYAQ